VRLDRVEADAEDLAFTGSPEELFTIYRTCFGDDGWTASLTATSQEAVRMPSGVRARVLP